MDGPYLYLVLLPVFAAGCVLGELVGRLRRVSEVNDSYVQGWYDAHVWHVQGVARMGPPEASVRVVWPEGLKRGRS